MVLLGLSTFVYFQHLHLQSQSLYGEEDANMGADELQQFAATLEPALRGSEHQLRKCVGVGGRANTGSVCCICSACVALPRVVCCTGA